MLIGKRCLSVSRGRGISLSHLLYGGVSGTRSLCGLGMSGLVCPGVGMSGGWVCQGYGYVRGVHKGMGTSGGDRYVQRVGMSSSGVDMPGEWVGMPRSVGYVQGVEMWVPTPWICNLGYHGLSVIIYYPPGMLSCMQKYSHWSGKRTDPRTHCFILCQPLSLYRPQS